MAQSEAGKGSAPRKAQDIEAYSTGWDRIFGNGKDKDTNSKTEKHTSTTSDKSQSGQAQGQKARG